MYQLQNLKAVNLLHASYTNGASATAAFDMNGFNEALITIKATTSDSTANNFSSCVLSESNDNTTFANITASVGDTAWTIPDADTSSVQIFQFHIGDTGTRKRYIKLTLVPTTTQIVTATALLGRAGELPTTTTEQGVVSAVNV